MSTDGCFRRVSRSVIEKVSTDPALAAAISRFHPPYSEAEDRFFWPTAVRESWARLLASGGRDTAAARAVHAEMKRVSHWFWLEPDELQPIAAAGIRLDEIPAGSDHCGAGWADLHLLVTGRSPVPPGARGWGPDVPLSPLLGEWLGEPGWDDGVRMLDPAAAAAAADALDALGDEGAGARYDELARGEDGTFPVGWEFRRREMVAGFSAARAVYAEARALGDGVLVYLE